jgi:hypothetical protein
MRYSLPEVFLSSKKYFKGLLEKQTKLLINSFSLFFNNTFIFPLSSSKVHQQNVLLFQADNYIFLL